MLQFIKRFKRLLNIIASRKLDYSELRQSDSWQRAVDWARRSPVQMFNGNALRALLVREIVETNQCNQFVETGTYHAATAIGVQRLLRIPVVSVEVSLLNYLISRFLTLGIHNIQIKHSDSRVFIKDLAELIKRNRNVKPFFYLDAHENESDPLDLPLIDEIKQILNLDDFVVLIDDFYVPPVSGYHATRYAGFMLEIELIENILLGADINKCYFPSYEAKQDSGYPSGYCVFWRSLALDAATKTGDFPFCLLKPYSIKDGRFLRS